MTVLSTELAVYCQKCLFLLPIYTHIFTPAEYGAIEMLTVMGSLLTAILGMGMDSAQSMYFFKHKEKGQKRRRVSY